MAQEIRFQSKVEVMSKTQKKMVLDTSLLNTQHYKVYIKGKVEQSREKSLSFFNGISTSVGHLMPRKVRLVLCGF